MGMTLFWVISPVMNRCKGNVRSVISVLFSFYECTKGENDKAGSRVWCAQPWWGRSQADKREPFTGRERRQWPPVFLEMEQQIQQWASFWTHVTHPEPHLVLSLRDNVEKCKISEDQRERANPLSRGHVLCGQKSKSRHAAWENLAHTHLVSYVGTGLPLCLT